ncbi:MAG: hypothetical protein IJS53_02060 [Clostridia bacterium]|nr:hypothetical protein [Clostridia bacterium]
MALLTINNADMPAPSSLTVRLEDGDASVRRALDGTACVRRTGVRRALTCQWSFLSGSDLSTLLTACTGSAALTVAYPDPATGERRSMSAVCSERSVGMLRQSQSGPVWTQVRLSFTEA